jgi:hypothetical protein
VRCVADQDHAAVDHLAGREFVLRQHGDFPFLSCRFHDLDELSARQVSEVLLV